MRRQGRELTVMALYALDGLPSFERTKALALFWNLCNPSSVWEALFATPVAKPHPLDEPPLWSAFDTSEHGHQEPSPHQLTTVDFAKQRINGIIHNIELIDQAIRDASRSWAIHRMPRVDRCILRLGAYELLFCSDIPPFAVINEALELSKEYADSQSRSFINGILDHIYQNLQQTDDQTPKGENHE
jgi:transcription antitermination factor NusB